MTPELSWITVGYFLGVGLLGAVGTFLGLAWLLRSLWALVMRMVNR